jgi:uncharacterized membrane protein
MQLADLPPQNVHSTERLASLVGGLAFLTLGLSRRSSAGHVASLLGGALIFRGATGFCPVKAGFEQNETSDDAPAAVFDYDDGFDVDHSVTVMRPATELYAFWRRFSNLPQIMDHLASVTEIDDKRSRWVAEGPAGRDVEWDAEVINDIPNELIAWKTLEGSDVTSAGSVHFTEAPGGRGTEVRVHLRYDPPFGRAGRLIAKLFREEPSIQVADDLRRFKQMMETGEVSTIEGQPTGRKGEE